MNYKIFFLFGLLACWQPIAAQHTAHSFYATMALIDAEELQEEHPQDITILAKRRNEAAVFLTEKASHQLHKKVLAHGPGYIFQPSQDAAISALHQAPTVTSKKMPLPFSITEDATVLQALNSINADNIENHIKELENYGTRYHTTNSARRSAEELKDKWEAMAAQYDRTDVRVRLVTHTNTPMPSVVMTIEGAVSPNDYVIVGGHLDSTSSQGNNNAPGADDDASGIATITEAARALFEIGFQPEKTIEVMAYAAEEIGLVGSAEIAKSYRNNNVNVVAVGQFDMTNYNGSTEDIYFIEDNTDPELNSFFKSLIGHYNQTGEHALTYSTSVCNYGCSDHASWHREGYRASFPFEASFSNSNPRIHTASDTFDLSGTATHAAKFAKLCAEFLIEVAKNQAVLSVPDFEKEGYQLFVQAQNLHYKALQTASPIDQISLKDVSGKSVLIKNKLAFSGNFSISNLPTGVYIATITTENKRQLSKKMVIR